MKKEINGYTAELELVDDRMCCFVSKGNYTSSLDVAMDFGTLENDRGEDILIGPRTIQAIETWAINNGW